MAQLILFGGGDAGGLLIGPKGVRPLPPIDPAVRSQLRGLSALLNGNVAAEAKQAKEMASLINKISNLLITQVQGSVGPLDAENSLIYQDEGGGFYCGSTGKPPIPFPWPPRSLPSLNDLIAAGALEHELVEFVSEIPRQKMDILQVLEDPAAAASKLGRKLSERTVKDLRQLAPSQLKTVSDPVNREVIQFFHTVAKDGRFLSNWAIRPYEVADQLKVKLSDEATDRILNAGAGSFTDANGRRVLIVLGIVIFIVDIVILVVFLPRESRLVRDTSGIEKF